jgi:hypothetical protein
MSRLRSKGIPVYARYSGSPWIGPYRAALFVYFDAQFQDACAVLLDPTHQVEARIDVDDFDRFINSQDISPSLLNWSALALVAAVAFLSGAVYFAR